MPINGILHQRIYKRLLSEAENDVPSTDDKAALIINSGDTTIGVLYRPSAYLSLKEKDYSFEAIISNPDVIYGYIECGPSSAPGTCQGAWEVNAVAGSAKESYAIAYASSPSGRIMPDRRQVSDSALASWTRIFSGGRQKFPLNGNCRTYDSTMRPGTQPLNFAYGSIRWEADFVQTLQNNHQQTFKNVIDNSSGDPPLTIKYLNDELELAGHSFFKSNMPW